MKLYKTRIDGSGVAFAYGRTDLRSQQYTRMYVDSPQDCMRQNCEYLILASSSLIGLRNSYGRRHIDISQKRTTGIYITLDSTPSPVFIVSPAQVKCYILTADILSENGHHLQHYVGMIL
jgi:hypothetical protein